MKIAQKFRQIANVLRGVAWYPATDYQGETVRLGSEYGGWTILPHLLSTNSVIYSFGVGEDISFDLALIERFGATVHAFDPTPKSLEWIGTQTLPQPFVIHGCALASEDGTLRLFPPANPSHVSYSNVAGSQHVSSQDSIVVPAKRLDTIMAELSHQSVDLVKMDVEGAEYGVIAALQPETAPRQLLVEFHHRFTGVGISATKRAVAHLRNLGYLLYSVSSTGEEFSFVLASALDARTQGGASRCTA